MTLYSLVVWYTNDKAITGVEVGTWLFTTRDKAYEQLRHMKANGWHGRVDSHVVML